jgi:hypothetical protein
MKNFRFGNFPRALASDRVIEHGKHTGCWGVPVCGSGRLEFARVAGFGFRSIGPPVALQNGGLLGYGAAGWMLLEATTDVSRTER